MVIYSLDVLFGTRAYLEQVCCSMSSSNCCFLTCIQVSQEADQVVWYSHISQNFLQFIVIHTVKGFGIVNKAEIDFFLDTNGHHHMVNTEIRLIVFFTDKDGEALYRQQKQDQELTVAQIRNSLLQNSDLN